MVYSHVLSKTLHQNFMRVPLNQPMDGGKKKIVSYKCRFDMSGQATEGLLLPCSPTWDNPEKQK